jgi:hypothetical protein
LSANVVEEKFADSASLSCAATPCAGINAPRIQNERGFNRGGSTAIAGGDVNSNQGRHTQNLTAATGADDFILLDQEIHVVFRRTLAGQLSQSSV